MDNKDIGLYNKYNISRVDGKTLGDCIVLEFKDPIARHAILSWAKAMREAGYIEVSNDVVDKLVNEEWK